MAGLMLDMTAESCGCCWAWFGLGFLGAIRRLATPSAARGRFFLIARAAEPPPCPPPLAIDDVLCPASLDGRLDSHKGRVLCHDIE
jgi:hypothetical protein